MKRLYIRLSSLGDVLLAAAALPGPPSPRLPSKDSQDEVSDWLTSTNYAALFEGHPTLRRVITFDRSKGLGGWLSLCQDLAREKYDEVFDLHRSWRTLLLTVYLRVSGSRSRIYRVSKQRVRQFGFFTFKSRWPKAWRPLPWWERHSSLARGDNLGRPDFSHLLQRAVLPAELVGRQYWVVMPGAAWPGKMWSAKAFAEVVAGLRILPVVVGLPSDQECHDLVALLKAAGREHVDGVGKWNFPELAQVIRASSAYLGNDTGLAHLAESLGVRTHVIFGPTHPQAGFGPWRIESQALGAALWCRPCGKDGRSCFRLTQRYACMKTYAPSEVLKALEGAAK